MPAKKKANAEEAIAAEPSTREVIRAALLKQIALGGSAGVQAAKVLSELEGLFDAQPTIDEATAKTIADLAKELLDCPQCGYRSGAPNHSPDCGCLECRQRREDRRLKDASLQPQREPVNVAECTVLEGGEV